MVVARCNRHKTLSKYDPILPRWFGSHITTSCILYYQTSLLSSNKFLETQSTRARNLIHISTLSFNLNLRVAYDWHRSLHYMYFVTRIYMVQLFDWHGARCKPSPRQRGAALSAFIAVWGKNIAQLSTVGIELERQAMLEMESSNPMPAQKGMAQDRRLLNRSTEALFPKTPHGTQI